MPLTANQYSAMIGVQRELVRAGVRPDIAGRMAQDAALRCLPDAGMGKVPQTRRVLTSRVVGGGQCVRIDLGPGMEPELYIQQQKYRDQGWNLMKVEPYGTPSREVWYACPPGQVPAEQQPLIVQAEVGSHDEVYQTAVDIAYRNGVPRERARAIADRVAVRFRGSGFGDLGQAGWRYPRVAPAIPMDPANRLLALPATIVYQQKDMLTDELILPPIGRDINRRDIPWRPPPNQCPWPGDIKNFIIRLTGTQFNPEFEAVRDPALYYRPGYDWNWAIQYSCSADLPIFGGNNDRAGEARSVPPMMDSKPRWYWFWWAWVYRVIAAKPTAEEKHLLDLLSYFLNPQTPQGTQNPFTLGRALPQEFLPVRGLDPGTDPAPFRDFVPYLLNLEAIDQARKAYPWPGPPAMFWQAFVEFQGGVVNTLVRRKVQSVTALQARTAITLGLLEQWDKIVDRVEALAKSYEKKARRTAMTRAIAIAVIGVAAAVFTGGATLVLVGAALATLSAYEKSKAAKQMAEFAAMFEENNPAFAAEVRRVAEEMGIGKDVAAAAPAEPVAVPGAMPEAPKSAGIPWALVAAPLVILGTVALAKG